MKHSSLFYLLAMALSVTSCNNDAVEEGDYGQWTAGMVTMQQGDNTLFFAPTSGGLMFTMDRYNMTYEKLVQMNGGSISVDNGGTGLTGVQTYKGSIEIPATVNGQPVVAIDQYALAGNMQLTGIKIPESVTQIGSEAFAICSTLDSVELPSQIKEITPGLFAGQGVRKVIIPDGVEKISHFAFLKNAQVDSVKIDTAKSKLTTIEPSAFYGCTALRYCPIPEGIQEIGAYAFRDCSKLEKTALPAQASKVNPYQYFNCSSLTELTLPASIQEIGDYAFYGCSKIVTFNQSENSELKRIGYRAFYNNKALTAFTLPEGLQEIKSQAFRECRALKAMTIPEGITAIKDSTFQNCRALEAVTLPSTLKEIGSYAFNYTALASIAIPDGISSIPSRAFFYCSKLTSVTLPESVENIGDKAFANCTNLRTITLPGNLKTMGFNVFGSCSHLSDIHIKSVTPPALSMSPDRKSATYYIPKGSLEAYQNAPYWKEITNYVEE